jgi:hypothetical protein
MMREVSTGTGCSNPLRETSVNFDWVLSPVMKLKSSLDTDGV